MGGTPSQSSQPPPSYSPGQDASTVQWLGEHPWAKQQNVEAKFGQYAPQYKYRGQAPLSMPGWEDPGGFKGTSIRDESGNVIGNNTKTERFVYEAISKARHEQKWKSSNPNWAGAQIQFPGNWYDQNRADRYSQVYGDWNQFAMPEGGGIDYSVLQSDNYVGSQGQSDSIVRDNQYTQATRYNEMAKNLMVGPETGGWENFGRGM